MPRESEDEYLGTPLLEGATTLMLIGGNEIGREILIEAHRLGLETILVSDHQYAPASHLSHRRYTLNLQDDEALRAVIRREQPDTIIQDSPAITPDRLRSAMEDHQATVLPNHVLGSLLQNQGKTLELASQAKATVLPFSVAVPEKLKDSCDGIGYPCTIVELNPNSDVIPRLVKSKADIDNILGRIDGSDAQARFLTRRFSPYDFRATVYVVASAHGTISLSAAIGNLGTLSYPHVSWQPTWSIDEHTQVSAEPFAGYGSSLHRREEGSKVDYLWESDSNGRYIPADTIRELEGRLKDSCLKTLGKLKESAGSSLTGVIRLVFEVRLKGKETGNKPEAYLSEASLYPDETAFLTLATQQPSIPACLIRCAAGIETPSLRITASAVAHTILAREKSGWAPAFFDLNAACKEEGTSIQLFGKHRFSAGEPVGMAFAVDDDVQKARERALTCAHKVEGAIDLGT